MALTNVISSSRISGDMRQKLDHVRVKWEAVIDILADSIKQSGKLAELAVSTCKEFIERILPHLANDSASFQSRKDIVDQFAQRQEGGVEQAAKMSQGFSDIKTGIQNLVEDVQAILDGYDLSGAERRIKGLDAEIRGIMNDMEGIRQEIASVTKQLDIVIAATSATAIIGVICPVWWIATAQAEKAEECRKKTEERNRLQGEVVFIAALRGAVEERKPEIDDVLAKLGTLATVWAAVRGQIHKM
ncbi:hypothetical protein K474DRAFT_408848 [Panus rudis PR-1116 ss-1]|nr:hypothetical protein K474DRAFT_408848 [Panus rudis PR-1116 ss-1]